MSYSFIELPENYFIPKDLPDDYVLKKGDLVYSPTMGLWFIVNGLAGEILGRRKQIQKDFKLAVPTLESARITCEVFGKNLKENQKKPDVSPKLKITKETKYAYPTSHELVENLNDNYVLKRRDYCWKDGEMGMDYTVVNMWAGLSIATVKQKGCNFTTVATKKAVKPKFTCSKPYPYGY